MAKEPQSAQKSQRKDGAMELLREERAPSSQARRLPGSAPPSPSSLKVPLGAGELCRPRCCPSSSQSTRVSWASWDCTSWTTKSRRKQYPRVTALCLLFYPRMRLAGFCGSFKACTLYHLLCRSFSPIP